MKSINFNENYKKITFNKISNIKNSSFNYFYIFLKKLFNLFLNFRKYYFYYKNNNKSFYFFSIFIIVIICIYFFAGFYIVKEAERGIVLRLGKFSHLVYPGLNWRPVIIDSIQTINVESVKELSASGIMLTSDENVVKVEMNVQYKINNPKNYLFNVVNPENSLQQATDSALRGVIGKYVMDKILTEGRTIIRSDTQKVLEKIIEPYNMGITLIDVNFQTARPPEEVKAAFDDAIAARENEQQYIREAEAYANEVQPKANGQAQRIIEDSRAYKEHNILQALGETSRFAKILPEYKLFPFITKERLYIETMENIFKKNKKILISNNIKNNLFFLQIDKFFDK